MSAPLRATFTTSPVAAAPFPRRGAWRVMDYWGQLC